MRRMPIHSRYRYLLSLSDVRPWSYAVLDGISPAYPPAMGRLHTCYSPVRRSPAVNGKPSTPLPLDLHVLSLSLAFILSQDQTLRCYIFFFFLSIKKSKTLKFVLLRTSPVGSRPMPRRIIALLCLFKNWHECFVKKTCSCTTLVYCNRFNVRRLLGAFARKRWQSYYLSTNLANL